MQKNLIKIIVLILTFFLYLCYNTFFGAKFRNFRLTGSFNFNLISKDKEVSISNTTKYMTFSHILLYCNKLET